MPGKLKAGAALEGLFDTKSASNIGVIGDSTLSINSGSTEKSMAEKPGKIKASAALEGLFAGKSTEVKAPAPAVGKVKASAALEGLFAAKAGPPSQEKLVERVAPNEDAKARLAESKAKLENLQAQASSFTNNKEKYAKYDKMLKMLPEGAVRQKMEMEGISSTEIESYFNSSLPGAQNSPEVSNPSPPMASLPSVTLPGKCIVPTFTFSCWNCK